MKQIKIDVTDESVEINHIGLSDLEVVGAMTAAFWRMELHCKMAWSNPFPEEKKDGTTDNNYADESTSDRG